MSEAERVEHTSGKLRGVFLSANTEIWLVKRQKADILILKQLLVTAEIKSHTFTSFLEENLQATRG